MERELAPVGSQNVVVLDGEQMLNPKGLDLVTQQLVNRLRDGLLHLAGTQDALRLRYGPGYQVSGDRPRLSAVSTAVQHLEAGSRQQRLLNLRREVNH